MSNYMKLSTYQKSQLKRNGCLTFEGMTYYEFRKVSNLKEVDKARAEARAEFIAKFGESNKHIHHAINVKASSKGYTVLSFNGN